MAPSKRGPRKSRARNAPQPKFPIVYVKYHDHCWLDAKELSKINVAKPYVVEETGFLLLENPKYITLAKERSTDGEKGKTQYDSVTIIMRSDILALEVFERSAGSKGARKKAAKGARIRARG